MAINLNLETYGDQFRAFVNFANANANDADTLACIQEDNEGALLDPDGKPRTIVAKTDDDKIKRFKHNLLFSRNDDQKALFSMSFVQDMQDLQDGKNSVSFSVVLNGGDVATEREL